MFIEFGAGKGYLTGCVAECYPEVESVVMMDVQGFKLAADRALRGRKMQRCRCDIADFEPRGVDGFIVCCSSSSSSPENESGGGGSSGGGGEKNIISGEEEHRGTGVDDGIDSKKQQRRQQQPLWSWVVHGKHLCGAATDLTLRCIARYSTTSTENGTKDDTNTERTNIPVERKLRGVAIAPCCRHRVTWQHYVGKDYIQQTVGLSPEEFEVMGYMTSWALCGHGSSEDSRQKKKKEKDEKDEEQREQQEHEHTSGSKKRKQEEGGGEEEEDGAAETPQTKQQVWRPHHTYSREERMEIGELSKIVIDQGRMEWMRGVAGLKQVESLVYCDSSVSGENLLLVGVK